MYMRKLPSIKLIITFIFLFINFHILSSLLNMQVMASTTVTIRFMVDGKAVVHLQNTSMWIDHIDAFPPGRNKGANVPFKINEIDAYANCYARTELSQSGPYSLRSCNTYELWSPHFVSDAEAKANHDSGIYWRSDNIDLTNYGIPDLNGVRILSYEFIQEHNGQNEYFNTRDSDPYNELLTAPSAENNWMTAWYINDTPCCMGWNTIRIEYDVDTCQRQCDNKCGNVPDGCGGSCTDHPSPSNAVLNGSYKESLSNDILTCESGADFSTPYPISRYIKLQNPDNKTLDCTNTGTTYSCNVSFSTPDDPQANFVIKSDYQGYKPSWFCPEGQTSVSVPAGQTKSSNIYFSFIGESWYKIKNSSLQSKASEVLIPYNIIPYDSDDDGSKQLIIGNAGLITATGDLYFTNLESRRFSENNFLIRNYAKRNTFANLDVLIDFAKNKGKNKVISQISDIASNPGYDIYILPKDLTINASNIGYFDNKSMFLIVNGSVKFANDLSGKFNPNSSQIILAAKNINFFETNNDPNILTEARGIFIAENFTTGNSNTVGLKIIGNLVTLSDQTIMNGRIPDTGHKPGVFVVFDPNTYIKAIKFFSNIIYKWN